MLYTTELLGHISYRTIVPKNLWDVNSFPGIFWRWGHILEGVMSGKEGTAMWEYEGEYEDLDDLIFEKDDGGPSER